MPDDTTRFEMIEVDNVPKHIIDDETKERVLTTLAFYGRNGKGAKACEHELVRQGVKVTAKTLMRYQKEYSAQMDLIIQKNNAQLLHVPIFHRTVRLQKIQEIVDNDSIATRDRLAALRLAKEEVDSMDVLKKFSPENYDRLPEAVRKEYEAQAAKILDAEFSVVPDKSNEPTPELKAEMDTITIPDPNNTSHQGEVK